MTMHEMAYRPRSFRLLAVASVAAGMTLAGQAFVPAAFGQSHMPHRGAPGAAVPAEVTTGQWCADYRRNEMRDAARMGGPNLRRLQAAQAELAPGFHAGAARDGLRLLAAYQAELETRAPDPMLAATYLALTSSGPVTLELLRQVNGLLCVSTSRAFAKAVVTEAEAERRQMAR